MKILLPSQRGVCTPVSYTHLDVYKRQLLDVRAHSGTLEMPLRELHTRDITVVLAKMQYFMVRVTLLLAKLSLIILYKI